MPKQPMSQDEADAVEDWLRRRGLPNLIANYDAYADVFTRAVPLMLVIWLLGIAGAYGDRFEGWSQLWAALAGAAFLAAVGAGVNKLRGRSAFQIPDRVGKLELATFVLAPAILPVLIDNGDTDTFVFDIGRGLVILLVIWFIYGFGMLSILRWAVGNLGRQIGDVFGLMIRSLPLLLVFTMFLFLNAELWQVADNFTWPLFFAASGGLVAVSALFVLIRMPRELEDIGNFDSPEQLAAIVNRSNAPIDGFVADPELTPPLSRIDRMNVGILASFTIGVQIALVMMIVGLFYTLFGIVAVRPETIGQWTTGGIDGVETLLDLQLFGSEVPITTELLKVTGFLMAFTALQFTVSALTDATFREEFFDELTGEIKEALAVRVVYMDRIGNKK